MSFQIPVDDKFYPTLGPRVCDFIEDNLVFGPGDLRGQPAFLDDEKRALVHRMYEVFPQGHPQEGRRRFKRVGISLRKGTAKTEFAAWIAACELAPEGPVRCIGWDEAGNPIGGPVTDPYIPLVAYTEEQTEELAYGALRVILELSQIAEQFDIGLERIIRKVDGGKAVALATAPDARDGARTTFQHFDETHRLTSERLKAAHKAMMANIPKRMRADAWSLETTTAPEPGAGSIAEATMDYAKAVRSGAVTDTRLFFFHREASDTHDLMTDDGVRAAVVEASGPAASWADIDSIVEQFRDPTSDRTYLERVWLNRLVQSSSQAFDVEQWRALTRASSPVRDRDVIVLGFDGSLKFDATALVATHVETGYQWVVGVWERPLTAQDWMVPVDEVEAAIRTCFAQYTVWRLYADPSYWRSYVSQWKTAFGEDRVVEWPTNARNKMMAAIENFRTAIERGLLSHDGDASYARHIANSRRRLVDRHFDESGQPVYLIEKERLDSPLKIDLAMAGVLSWQARTDAIAEGAHAPVGVLAEWV